MHMGDSVLRFYSFAEQNSYQQLVPPQDGSSIYPTLCKNAAATRSPVLQVKPLKDSNDCTSGNDGITHDNHDTILNHIPLGIGSISFFDPLRIDNLHAIVDGHVLV
jgi:hypothetical protein